MGSIDKYVYPGSDILINKFDCHNKAELEKLEALSTPKRYPLFYLSGCL